MALSNAERQRRYIARLKAAAVTNGTATNEAAPNTVRNSAVTNGTGGQLRNAHSEIPNVDVEHDESEVIAARVFDVSMARGLALIKALEKVRDEKIRALHEAHPAWSDRKLASECGDVGRNLVRRVIGLTR
jgi:hypothetical protein